ncbi:hypothetical protein Tco_1032985 [Tanacetum coccineum]|uniref:Xylulose kinase-1 n=1 Tax=Tanacetum coccineum TaxID=301880 RepID=A0ABQ5GF20_9ASTR
MSTLTFVDTHNMVAFLEKPTESDGFHEIIDFLNATQIRYALTVNPTIYTSCIEQFWATAKVKTVNGELHIQTLIDKKKLGDMSHHKNIYVNPSHTKKIFANMRREEKDFSRRVTPLFDTMMVQANQEEGIDSSIPTDSNQTPITTQPSSSRSQKKQSKRKQRKDTAVLDLEKAKDAQAKEIVGLKKMGRSDDAEMFDINDLHGDEVVVDMPVGEKQEQSAKEREVDTSVEDSATPTTIEEITLAQTLIQIKAAKPKVFTLASTTTTTTKQDQG